MVADGNLTPKQGFLNPEHGFRMVRKRKEKKKNREEREKKKKKEIHDHMYLYWLLWRCMNWGGQFSKINSATLVFNHIYTV